MHHDTALLATIAADQAYLERQGVLAVIGERELALGMARYALRGLGLGADQVDRTVQVMRLLPTRAHGVRAPSPSADGR